MNSDLELNEIGVLKRREIEARVLAPVLEALGKQFGRSEVLKIARGAIIEVARQQGKELAERLKKNDLETYGQSLEAWTRDGALQLQILDQGNEKLSFNVTECKYAELYRNLGMIEIGSILSCSRDAAFIEGFNSSITFERTQTIMQGAAFCDFRFRAHGSGNE
jgi:predicted ArsR family transcriptional regulator